MKKFSIILFAAAALTTASCSNDEVPASDDARASFTATIAGTRAIDTSWEADDAIGISGTTGAATYTNVKYVTANADGIFTIANSGEDIYYQSNDDVTFTAYYPWTAFNGANVEPIAFDTRNQAQSKSFDYLWAQAVGKKSSPNVAFAFAHKMSKVVLTVKKGADVSFAEVKDAHMLLSGFVPTGSFDVVTGVAAASGDVCADHEFAGASAVDQNAPSTVDADAETVAYSLIIAPQTFAAQPTLTAQLVDRQSFSTPIDFTAANRNAGDTNPVNSWVAGRQYNISVALHKTSITVEGCTITNWVEADGGNFDAK